MTLQIVHAPLEVFEAGKSPIERVAIDLTPDLDARLHGLAAYKQSLLLSFGVIQLGLEFGDLVVEPLDMLIRSGQFAAHGVYLVLDLVLFLQGGAGEILAPLANRQPGLALPGAGFCLKLLQASPRGLALGEHPH